MTYSLIVAMDEKRGIGKAGDLPWHLSEDLQHFKRITTSTSKPEAQNLVIMGRRTWESIPEAFRPLPDRINAVVSRNSQIRLPASVIRIPDFGSALAQSATVIAKQSVEQVFVIGGQQLFELSVDRPACERIFITRIDGAFECDVFFPPFEHVFSLHDSSPQQQSRSGMGYRFMEYRRRARV